MQTNKQAHFWDKEDALSRLGGDEDILKQVVCVYVKETHKGLALLQEAVDAQDIDNILIYAHALKGSAATVSGTALVNIAEKIENSMKAGDSSNLKIDFQTLKAVLEELLKELKVYCQSPS